MYEARDERGHAPTIEWDRRPSRVLGECLLQFERLADSLRFKEMRDGARRDKLEVKPAWLDAHGLQNCACAAVVGDASLDVAPAPVPKAMVGKKVHNIQWSLFSFGR
jgi:hypothetical protein